MNIDKLIGNVVSILDLPDRIEGLISTFVHANWPRARRQGAGGYVGEALASLTAQNAPLMQISHYDVNTAWSGRLIEQLLQRHGVRLWDRGISGDNLYFRVEARRCAGGRGSRRAQLRMDKQVCAG